MYTEFKIFGLEHILSILIPSIWGLTFIYWGLKSKSVIKSKKIRMLLVILIVIVRGSRYIMDLYYGRFNWFDLFSLHICHIDLIILIMCLIRPRKLLFSFNFLIGIPAGLAVTLMPGTYHLEPGTLRAMLFIMSHMMLVWGALYLAVVEKMRVNKKSCFSFMKLTTAGMVIIYIINKAANTNFLYLIKAPKGTVIEGLYNILGWPGYVFAMYGIGILSIFLMLLFSGLIEKMRNGKVSA